VRQKNLRGDKGIDLVTGHSVALPWLTGLDTPAEVLGLAGAVVDREGKVVRAGFEGLVAKRTGLAVGSVGAEEVLRTEDVERLRAESRRPDLPGEPLLWRAALESLVTQLLAPPRPVTRAKVARVIRCHGHPEVTPCVHRTSPRRSPHRS
jgi:hypothetical protein